MFLIAKDHKGEAKAPPYLRNNLPLEIFMTHPGFQDDSVLTQELSKARGEPFSFLMQEEPRQFQDVSVQ
ncbi:hypothetical protein CCP2SC5_100042 [Azospirillaceae bacterium]